MIFSCKASRLQGNVVIPGSKSHTIRACAIAAMAKGQSTIIRPLVSADTLAAAEAAAALGAEVDMRPDRWCITGTEGVPAPTRNTIDVGNSGTTLRIIMGLASHLASGSLVLTGDDQIQRRPAGQLANALTELGASVTAQHGNGCAPFDVAGTLRGGQVTIEAPTSQFVTSLLLACPLASRDTILDVPLLNERPYVQMTLDWLSSQGIEVPHDDMARFHIPGGQGFRAFNRPIPADFSSATFFLGAGALQENSVTCLGLDLNDSQADKKVIDYIRAMGADVTIDGDAVSVSANTLEGLEIDLNETPDALPVMAVLGCFAEGETRLVNVAHARIKETDRIAVMCAELTKMGADIAERADGLVVRHSSLHGAHVEGHHDHRVVMALALAGMACPGETVVTTAEAAGVTFPEFGELMVSLGAKLGECD
ncbi:MAG: 3-phosphoshikimate 1-carboxyvinyltransferase [Lentisphaerae bacterium]|jgi:3-phosphoshikimate 1-carboxyvinyltransferase|nr:3-phosphoshikimate 1-carboxyvinyltransferase [Lentisphaerota bacterium]MBT4820996.1 3-phosphoshikimate 1-carboxyvinyltransferase [Lentisphaerota bacterium]MBT5610257.1 3-phosphoshikimate 1-carboxyvinyltransferase [Lentisphaerota bacterium]MBT7055726.1 3-phosphoshikimate 1-carboxyvinyltransferase [Lentisphaerota bacterium]MBT7846021.1 3-phosphoshikimate 1-carboxyvinyltransferase [Lentisphaerota bacterium]